MSFKRKFPSIRRKKKPLVGTFIGTTSMGFVKGRTYKLKSKIETIFSHGVPRKCICLYDTNTKAWCPYSSLENVLENWVFEQEE